jgi:hypothetical protein
MRPCFVFVEFRCATFIQEKKKGKETDRTNVADAKCQAMCASYLLVDTPTTNAKNTMASIAAFHVVGVYHFE